MLTSLWRRCPRAGPLALSRGFAAAALQPAEDVAAARKKQSVYYERIERKRRSHDVNPETTVRTTSFLMDRGLSETQVLRIFAHHVMAVHYTEELMESKIKWLSELGLSHDKINNIIVRHPNILGITIDKYEALVDWYISHGVPRSKIAYLFNIFPGGVSYNIKNNLEPKVEFFKKIGCNEKEVARVLSRSPNMFTLSVERLHTNVPYLVKLGVPRERLPGIISSCPECLGLTQSRIKETMDLFEEMYGAGAGIRALLSNSRIVMYSIKGIRESYSYLISVGFTKERLQKNTAFITRNTTRFLRPRVQFLKTKGVDVVSDITWIMMPERHFVTKYPEYAAYVKEFKVELSKQ